MTYSEERMRILEMIEKGQISATEGLELLQNLVEEPAEEIETAHPADSAFSLPVDAPFAEMPLGISGAPGPGTGLVLDQASLPPEPLAVIEPVEAFDASAAAQAEPVEEMPAPELAPQIRKWRNWWLIPLSIGVGVAVIGGYWMYLATASSSAGWLLCASIPFALGVLIIFFAWQSQNAPWLHVRVQEEEQDRQKRVAISFPIPIKPTLWFLRTFQHKIPDLEEVSLDQIIQAVGDNTSPENPIYIQVDEGEKGSHVEIYIG
jgi:hypothetical protein